MRFLLVFALLFLLAAAPVHAQAPGTGGQGGIGPAHTTRPQQPPPAQSIAFAEDRLVLGMPQDEVLDRLSKNFELVRREKDVFWVNQNTGGTIGMVYFAGGLLTQVSRDWEILEPEAGPALLTMKTAIAAFRQMIPGDPRDCKVDSNILNPAAGVAVSCGKMLVQLYVTSSDGEPDRVFVYTALGSHDGPDRFERDPPKPSSGIKR
jgi:hypothetical protein